MERVAVLDLSTQMKSPSSLHLGMDRVGGTQNLSPCALGQRGLAPQACNGLYMVPQGGLDGKQGRRVTVGAH
jgi:hypothetical protein